MGLWDKIRGQFIDIIEWLDDTHDTMVFRFDRQDNEIKYGAQLIVREGQLAVFVNEGQIADVFQPGTHTLLTRNMPILTTLRSWPHGFESPFKAEVYFVSTKRFIDLKWGTKNPIMMRDPEFGPIRIRAFGTYAVRVGDAETFMREIVGTDGLFSLDEMTKQLRNVIVSRFADVVAERNIPILDLAADYDETGAFLADQIRPDFEQYGIELTELLVENVSLPPAVEEAMDKRTSMGVLGNLDQYTKFQAANAMESAAKNPGGGMGEGLGMGMGMAMANQMAQAHQQPQQQAPQAPDYGEPPAIPTVKYFVAVDGQKQGPYDTETLAQQAEDGAFDGDTLVWRKGMSGWKKAAEVNDLASVLEHIPPPLPPG